MNCPIAKKNCRELDLETFGSSKRNKMKKKQVARFSSTQSALLDQIKNQLENDRVKVFTGSLEDRYQIYFENTSEDPPKTFDEWLGI